MTDKHSTKDLLQCVLVEPTGRYEVPPGEFPRFSMQTSEMIQSHQKLNEQNIIPTITSGYRSPAYQKELRRSGRGITPAEVSRHQIGDAVDFGTNSNQGNNEAIRRVMTDAGFAWGGVYKKPDPVHYQPPTGGWPIDPEYIRACVRTMTGK